jgi:hypothetical protein
MAGHWQAQIAMIAPTLSEIVVLDFDSDVRSWNAHRGHHEDWITDF